MKKFLVILLLVFGFNSLAFTQNSNVKEEKMYSISLIQLLANPEKYHGKKIHVMGYLNLEFEGNAIYLHKEDYEHSLVKNGFWVEISNKTMKNGKEINQKYVLIEGEFDMNSHGHMGLWSGSIKNITRCDEWR
jgi:hypothetical protein